MYCTKQTLIRTAVLMIALLNQILTVLGKNPLPFSDEAVYEGLTAVFTAAAGLWAWWKNNSFTAEAAEADRYLSAIRTVRQNGEDL
jgi:SPP1 family holin